MSVPYKNNQTIKFILPLVVDLNPFTIIRKELIGAYIGDVEEPKYDGKLLLAYKYPYTIEWARFEKKLINLDNYRTSYDYTNEDDINIVVYVFDLPEEVENDVSLIMDGYYSKLSAMSKLEISKFWFSFTRSRFVEYILDDNTSEIEKYWRKSKKNKRQLCQRGEHWFKPTFSDELFDISDI